MLVQLHPIPVWVSHIRYLEPTGRGPVSLWLSEIGVDRGNLQPLCDKCPHSLVDVVHEECYMVEPLPGDVGCVVGGSPAGTSSVQSFGRREGPAGVRTNPAIGGVVAAPDRLQTEES